MFKLGLKDHMNTEVLKLIQGEMKNNSSVYGML